MNNGILNDDSLDLDADFYTKQSSLQNNLANEILNNIHVNPYAHILDVGCGDGRITAVLANRANQGNVIGIDASPNMIEFAQKNFSKKTFPNLDFLQLKAEDVKFTQQFDLIVSFSCFHWLSDPKFAISLLNSTLKKGGELLILTYPKESPYYGYLQTALKNYPEYFPLSANHTMLSADSYKQLLLEENLEVVDFQQKKLIASYSTSKEIQEYIKGWLNNYVYLPKHLHDSFLQDVVQAVLNDPSTREGEKIIIPYTALVMRARKK